MDTQGIENQLSYLNESLRVEGQWIEDEIKKLRHTIAAVSIWKACHSDCPQEAEEQLELALFRVDSGNTLNEAVSCIQSITQTAAGASNASRTDPGMVVS